MAIRRILLVGHCGFDAPNLRAAVERIAEGVAVEEASTASEVEGAGGDTLLLVNRQLGYGFGTYSGVDLIRKLGQGEDPPATMLISNYEDAQQEAVEAGARLGFGKAQLGTAEMRQRLLAALGEGQPQRSV